jgi:hypothetical protein
MQSGGSEVEFQRDLSGIAMKHGLTFWENEKSTYIGIGAGLKKAGLKSDEMKQFLYSFSARDRKVVRLIRTGYEKF